MQKNALYQQFDILKHRLTVKDIGAASIFNIMEDKNKILGIFFSLLLIKWNRLKPKKRGKNGK